MNGDSINHKRWSKLPFFSKAVYKYIQCTDTYKVAEHLTKDDVVDIEVIEAINKV